MRKEKLLPAGVPPRGPHPPAGLITPYADRPAAVPVPPADLSDWSRCETQRPLPLAQV